MSRSVTKDQDAVAGVPETAAHALNGWLARLNEACSTGEPSRVAALFTPDGHWRDILALTWDYRTFSGRATLEAALGTYLPAAQPGNFRIAPSRMAPRLVERSGRPVIEGFADFDTKEGRGTALVQLVYDEDRPPDAEAWILLTTLQELRGFEERRGARRPSGIQYSRNFAGDNWWDGRVKAAGFADRDPQVLVVGAGQGGLTLAARLGQMGVDTLVVERNERVGDNWRNRYHALALHNQTWANHMPYLPFPDTWPTFLPKDKVGGWLECYAETMELNVWTSTELLSATYDESARMWDVVVGRAGEPHRLRVPHVVLAIGAASGIPNIPALPGLDQFGGEVLHSSGFDSGRRFAGRRAIVVGTGNSGHDVAQDLYSNGAAEVTIVQRGPTTVLSLDPSGMLLYTLFSEGPADDIDFVIAARPLPVLRENYKRATRQMREMDRELLAGLDAAGFHYDFGVDDTGFHMKYLTTGGGYYINVGCSELIADGKIKILQWPEIDRFARSGARLVDGRSMAADLVVLCTGYHPLAAGVRRFFGPEVADRVGPIWGLNDEGFLRNMWTRTPQPGLWVMGGSFTECRPYSRYLALLIRAELEGLLPEQRPDGDRPTETDDRSVTT
jgi:cation diffusion facilitator CzcD-associated flavoprotein CzcO